MDELNMDCNDVEKFYQPRMNHNWFMDLRHFLFGHQILWGNWVEVVSNDGCSDHARCRYCGYKGMIDSQGNLF